VVPGNVTHGSLQVSQTFKGLPFLSIMILGFSSTFFSSGRVLHRAKKKKVATKVNGDQSFSSMSQIVPRSIEAFHRTVRRREMRFVR